MNNKPAHSFQKRFGLASGLLALLIISIFTLAYSLRNSKDIKTGLGAIQGDCDGNGTVNILDFQILSNSFGKTQGQTGYDGRCDFNGSNSINILDFQILSNNFGKTGPTNTPTKIPTKTPTPSGPTPSFPPPPQGSGFWITKSEIASLPASGAAWDRMRSAAYGSWGSPDLKDQNNKYGISVMAGALVYAKTGDPALRTKVKNGIIAAKRTLDESGEYNAGFTALSLTRQLGTYPLAADLIDLKNFDSGADNEFRSWLSHIRTTNVGTHSRWKNITHICENSTANWSAFSCGSRIASSLYLGDTKDVQRSALIFRALLGERNYYPANAPGTNGYFQHTSAYQSSWACNESTWTGVNPSCTKSGVNIDGVLVEDASRGGGCCTIQGSGISYSWESMQGFYVTAELLYRQGYDSYNWSNKALKRAMDFMRRSAWSRWSGANYTIWMANKRYGTSYPTDAASTGRIMAWSDWTHQ